MPKLPTNADPTSTKVDYFEVASIVASRVELDAIILMDSQTWRHPEFKLPEEDSSLSFSIESTNHGKSLEDKKVFVKLSFLSQDSTPTNEDQKNADTFFVKATFVLIYDISSFDQISDENLFAFSVTTGIYNAWPYWREYLQNTTTRMGLPPIIAPPFRFVPKQESD